MRNYPLGKPSIWSALCYWKRTVRDCNIWIPIRNPIPRIEEWTDPQTFGLTPNYTLTIFHVGNHEKSPTARCEVNQQPLVAPMFCLYMRRADLQILNLWLKRTRNPLFLHDHVRTLCVPVNSSALCGCMWSVLVNHEYTQSMWKTFLWKRITELFHCSTSVFQHLACENT